MSDTIDWRLIANVAPECRDRFCDLASASAFATRASLFVEDVINSPELARMQMEFIQEFGATHDFQHDDDLNRQFEHELASLANQAPVIRREVSDKEIEGWVWGILGDDDSIWSDSTFVFDEGRYAVIYSGLKFDFAEAARFDIRLSDPKSGEKPAMAKPRKLPSRWNPWIASVAWLVSEGKIHGGLTPTDLIKCVADDMAEKGIDEMPRATVQDATNAILDRFREEGFYNA